MSRDAIIIGTGGFAIELGGLIAAAGYRLVGYIGPAPSRPLRAPLLGSDDDLKRYPPGPAILVAIGAPALRQRLAGAVVAARHDWAGFVHPTAWIAPDAKIGQGVIIYPNSTIHSGCSVGDGVVINSNVSVGHETRIAAFASINPGVALGGRMDIGAKAYIGIGAAAVEEISIAADAIVGAGAVVIDHLTEAGTYFGVPARKVK